MKTGLVRQNHPVLRQKAKTVTVFDAKLRLLAIKMHYLMKAKDGIGLAACQVGKSIRFIIVSAPADSFDVPKTVYMVNPELTYKSEEVVDSVEGCLSIPGVFYRVQRHKIISVKYQDVYGVEKFLVGDGLFSLVVQHECQHNEGILMSDLGVPA